MLRLWIFALFFISTVAFSKNNTVDSLRKLIDRSPADTMKANYLWQLGYALQLSAPDSAVLYSMQSYFLSKNLKYKNGVSRALGVMAGSFSVMGNSVKAFELNIERLRLEEELRNPENLASLYLSLGIDNLNLKDFNNAGKNFDKADSIVNTHKLSNYLQYVYVNKGDLFNKLGQFDSSILYLSKALKQTNLYPNPLVKGTTLINLGNAFAGNADMITSKKMYHDGIAILSPEHHSENMAEGLVALAKIFFQEKNYDSARNYAEQAIHTLSADYYNEYGYEAARMLQQLFAAKNQQAEAYHFLSLSSKIRDSLFNIEKVLQIQNMNSAERLRQASIEEQKATENSVRKRFLQLTAIAIFIPFLFMVTQIMSRRKVNVRFVRLMGTVTLLFFFEFITLILHPTVAYISHHNPFVEILIFVAIGSIVVPLHHRAEHWVLEKLEQQDVLTERSDALGMQSSE